MMIYRFTAIMGLVSEAVRAGSEAYESFGSLRAFEALAAMGLLITAAAVYRARITWR